MVNVKMHLLRDLYLLFSVEASAMAALLLKGDITCLQELVKERIESFLKYTSSKYDYILHHPIQLLREKWALVIMILGLKL